MCIRDRPYRKWIEKIRIKLDAVPAPEEKTEAVPASLLDRQQAFGYTQEDIKIIIEPMVQNGEEPTGSMGTDSALPVLSNKNKTLYTYFKQLFAQVTNPPIRLEVSQPVLTRTDMEKLRHISKYTSGKFRSFELDICYPCLLYTSDAADE